MKRSNRLILLIGIFLAIVAFVGVYLIASGDDPSTTDRGQPSELPTVVATQDIALGATITSDMVTTQTLAVTARNAGAFESTSQVVGKPVRTPVTTGQQITEETFTGQSGQITALAQSLPPGQRAISVQVDQVTGVGTVIQPGDYVDLLVGFTGDKFPVVQINPEDDSVTVVAGINTTSVKLLLEGMQVLGTLLPAPTADEGGGGEDGQTDGDGGTTLNEQQQIVILAVTPNQAEVIKYAQLDGNVSLILRSPKDFFDEETGEPIVPVPAGTGGITLRKVVDDLVLPIPELVEAILPAQG